MNRTKNERWMDKSFYKALKQIESSKHLLNSGQTRLLDRSIKNCVLNGINLNEANSTMCRDLNNKIVEQQNLFKSVHNPFFFHLHLAIFVVIFYFNFLFFFL
jgi:hypothetical protein